MSSPTGSQPASDETDWRASVKQSYRSTEVKEIANVLAALEPGATSTSKLMLAMRFEDSLFSSAASLADYRKKIKKRLKKLQKAYVPTTQTTATPTTATSANKLSDQDLLKQQQQERIQKLQQKYGDSLLLIAKNADKAVAVMKEKNGQDRATHLRQHTENALQWAKNLGLIPLSGTLPANTAATGSTTLSVPLPMEPAKLDKLEQHLAQRVENIRSHVVKLTDYDTFLYETLETLEDDISESTAQILASVTSRRLARVGWTEFANPLKTLEESLEKVLAIIPPSAIRNSNTTNDGDLQEAVVRLEKIRAASQAFLAFTSIPDKHAPGVPRNVLMRCHQIAVQGIDFAAKVTERMTKDDKTAGSKVELQDAWTKVLELAEDDATQQQQQQVGVLKSRVLFSPGRKIPSNLIAALKRKRARLVQPPPHGLGAHVVLDFPDAFTMTIYLSPLLVTIRAIDSSPSAAAYNDSLSFTTHCCATFTPVHKGLSNQTTESVNVLGASGTMDMLGHVVKERLEQASAQATHILRACFASSVGSRAKSDFEVEISEATALLKFLQLSRTTYMPNFQEDDDGDDRTATRS